MSASAACGSGTFTPNRQPPGSQWSYPTVPATHNTIYLTDPANQQYAAFDLEWGGGLVSLKYKASGNIFTGGVVDPTAPELIWGHDPGGMAQFAGWTGNATYNPTHAGDLGAPNDWGRGSPIYSAACKNGNTVVIQSSTTEYNKNDATWGQDINYGRAATISAGAPRTDMWFTPYAISMTATFVPTGGTPSYYLKLDHYIHNTDVRETFGGLLTTFALYSPVGFSYRAYAPSGCFTSNCTATSTPLRVGLYPTSALTNGVAATTVPSGTLTGMTMGQGSDSDTTFWMNQSGYLDLDGWQLAAGTGRRFTVYVQAGDWTAANAFNP